VDAIKRNSRFFAYARLGIPDDAAVHWQQNNHGKQQYEQQLFQKAMHGFTG
jgi:hypothetical protein